MADVPFNFEGLGVFNIPEELLQGDEATVNGNLARAYREISQSLQAQQPMASNAGTEGRGLAEIRQGAATTARRVGEALGAPETGAAIGNFVAPDPASIRGQSVRDTLREDFFGNLTPGNVLGLVRENLPDLAAAWASMKAGAAVGGAVGGPIGAGIGGVAGPILYTAARALGPRAEQAARNNGRDTPNAEDWARAAGAVAVEGVSERVGLAGGGAVRRVFNEGASESLGGVAGDYAVSVGTAAGAENPTVSSVLTDFTGGAGARGAVDAGAAAIRAPGQIGGAAVRGIADLTRSGEVRNMDDEQIASDLRVIQAYERRRAAEENNSSNTRVDASVTFKGVMDDYARAVNELNDTLLRSDQITQDQHRTIRLAVSEAARHNRNQAGASPADYFDTVRDRVQMAGLDPRVERLVLDATRDLNTATYNSLYRNRRGPFESIAGSFPAGSVLGGVAGIASGNPAAVLAPLLLRGALRRGGAALDRVAGTNQPEVLARRRVLAREAGNRGLTTNPLAPEIRSVQQGAVAQAQQRRTQAQQAANQYNQQANQMGLVRGGGWAPAIMQQASNIAPGIVDIEDPVRAVEDLARQGAIPRNRADQLINDRTARPNEAEMRLITDYVVTAATQANRASWNQPTQRPQAQVNPDPPVTQVQNQMAYAEKMRSVAALNDAIRAQATDPRDRATAEAVINAKSRADKEAILNQQGVSDPVLASLLTEAIDSTSARSGTPGRSTSVVGPEGRRARLSAARPGVGVEGIGRDPTARVSRRAGLGVNEDVPRAARQTGEPRKARTSPGSKPVLTQTTVGDAVKEAKVQAPVITMQDLVGKKVFPIIADLTAAGVDYTGIDGSELTVPIKTQGGPGFPLLKEFNDAGIAWAVRGEGRGTAKLNKDADYAIVVAMDKAAHRSNATVASAVVQTLEAYTRDGRISPENLEKITQIVHEAGEKTKIPEVDPKAGPKKQESQKSARATALNTKKQLLNFPGFRDNNVTHDYINGMTFENRARLADLLMSKAAQNLGAPNGEKILERLRDPAFDGYNWGDAILVLEIGKGKDAMVNLKEAGLPEHKSYEYGLRGRVIGRLPAPIPYTMIWRDFFQEKANSRDDDTNSNDRRAFELALPVQEITQEIANGAPTGDFGAIKNAKHAQAVLDVVLGRWRTTDDAKNQGGVSPQEFLDAIASSDAFPTLTQYTREDLRTKLKSGSLKVYQLGDNAVYFGIAQNYDYSSPDSYGAKHPDLQGPQKALVSVVNNERGSRGIGASSILKAIEEGVEVLDCYAVKSPKHPNGFLPDYYGAFGFEVVETVPFDPKYVLDGTTAGTNKMRDLEKFWKDNGWTPDQGYPEIAIMKWRGTDAQRKNATQRYIRADTGRLRDGDTTGLIASAVSLGRRSGEQGGTRGGSRGPDQGTPGGDQGPRNRASVGSGLQRGVLSLATLDDRGIQALGLDSDTVQRARGILAEVSD